MQQQGLARIDRTVRWQGTQQLSVHRYGHIFPPRSMYIELDTLAVLSSTHQSCYCGDDAHRTGVCQMSYITCPGTDTMCVQRRTCQCHGKTQEDTAAGKLESRRKQHQDQSQGCKRRYTRRQR